MRTPSEIARHKELYLVPMHGGENTSQNGKKLLWEALPDSSHCQKVLSFRLPSAPSIRGQPSSGCQASKPPREIYSLFQRLALQTRADSCHSQPSHLSWLSQPHLTSVGLDSYSLLLPGQPPLTALLSVKESAHLCPHVGLRKFEPRASESRWGSLRAPAAPVARRCPCRSPTQKASTPRSCSRFSLPDAPPWRASLTWRLFIFLRSPKMSKPDAGRCVPTAPARTMAGSPGAETAGPLPVSQTAAEHRPDPAPAYQPLVLAGHVTGNSLGRLGMVVFCES